MQVLDVLVHELVHAVDDCRSGHGKEFKRIAAAVGLEGPARRAAAGPALLQQLGFMAEVLGPYPHRKIAAQPRRARRTARVYRWACDDCGCVFQMTKEMHARFAVELCPACGHSGVSPAGQQD